MSQKCFVFVNLIKIASTSELLPMSADLEVKLLILVNRELVYIHVILSYPE